MFQTNNQILTFPSPKLSVAAPLVLMQLPFAGLQGDFLPICKRSFGPPKQYPDHKDSKPVHAKKVSSRQ